MRGHTAKKLPGERQQLFSNGRKVRGYQLVAEKALGRPVSWPHIVHHHTDTQLVICENQSYHSLLHVRTRVVAAGGNPNTDLFCAACGLAKPATAFNKWKHRRHHHCAECRSAARRSRYAAGKAR